MTFSKIAVEEHFSPPDFVDRYEKVYPREVWAELRRRLLDIHGQLLADMDAHDVEISLLSLVSAGIQSIPVRQDAIDSARRANDFLAEQVARRPDRFRALAALPSSLKNDIGPHPPTTTSGAHGRIPDSKPAFAPQATRSRIKFVWPSEVCG